MLIIFLVAAYAVTWTLFTVVALAVPARTAAGHVLVLAGAFAPSAAALCLTALRDGRTGVQRLLEPVLIADVGIRYYVFALAYTASIKLTAALLHRMLIGGWPRFDSQELAVIPAAILLSTPFQAGEEIGWRGFALPRLAARFGFPLASVILGLIWAGWHLPQFYIAEADTYHQAFLVWSAQVVALSVAMGWLYMRTRGSLLLAMLMHSAFNNSKDIVPSAAVGPPPGVFSLHASSISWLVLMLMWTVAAWCLTRMRSVPTRS